MEIISDSSRDKVNQIALETLEKSIKNVLQKKSHLTLGFSGGSSIIDFLKLVRKSRNIPWECIHIFMVDERCVPITDHDSNYKQLYDLLINQLVDQQLIPPRNAHPFLYHDFSIIDYNQQLSALGGSFDIIVLGMGEDGHIASLFPQHKSVTSEELFYILITDAPKDPPLRISATKKLLMSANTSLLFFWGNAKKIAFDNLRDDSSLIEECPAKLVQNIANSYLFTDLESSNE